MFDESSPSTGSNALAGVPDASAVTTWQAAVLAGGAARSRMASKSFTRLPFLERIEDVPVLQITDELLHEADAAVRGSGERSRCCRFSSSPRWTTASAKKQRQIPAVRESFRWCLRFSSSGWWIFLLCSWFHRLWNMVFVTPSIVRTLTVVC